ncbi:MAG: hypothetical protein HY541_05095 [Deltaproteobacteria bacterium]|nr:hypothetical protein [Deltaproteobacteria bacterium]
MSNEISQQSYPVYPDPRMDPWDYQAALSGFKNGEEFKKEYFNQAKKAVVSGVAAGTGVFAAGFGLSAGVVSGLDILPAAGGFLIRAGVGLCRAAKIVGLAAWNTAQSAWYSLAGAASTPQGQEVIKNTVECVGSFVPGIPPSTEPISHACTAVSMAHTAGENSSE